MSAFKTLPALPVNAPDEWLTRAELAEQLGVASDTFARWATRRTRPPNIRLGRTIYYRREAVRACPFLRHHPVPSRIPRTPKTASGGAADFATRCSPNGRSLILDLNQAQPPEVLQ